MTTFRASLLVAAASLAVLAGPAAAKSPLTSPQGSSETIGPSAAGKAKYYTATVPAECEGDTCTVDFGKKKDKLRHIDALTCVLSSAEANLVAAVSLTGTQSQYDFLIPPASNEPVGEDSYSVFAWTQRFDVPKNSPILITLLSAGEATFGLCTVKGTIE